MIYATDATTRTDPLAIGIRAAVLNSIPSQHLDWAQLRISLAQLLGAGVLGKAYLGFAEGSYGLDEFSALAVFEYFRDCCGLADELQLLAGLCLIAENAGWMLPHKEICWLSDRPLVLKHDGRGRLHNPIGPSLNYCALHNPDGWSYYAWKGIEVPAWTIEHKDRITLEAIATERSMHVRRCMIEILSPARFVAMGGAIRLAEDETGVLWRAMWRFGDAWAAVEVVNGTPESDGSHRRYYLQVPADLPTPRAAVAWSYGLDEHAYRDLVRRT
jgi:hypothetical protein